VARPASRCICGASRHTSIRPGIVLGARVEKFLTATSPNDHFAARPHCGMAVSRRGGIASAGSCPTVRDGIISAATVKNVAERIPSAPNNHFGAGPDSGDRFW
jgi:hypothetical protein